MYLGLIYRNLVNALTLGLQIRLAGAIQKEILLHSLNLTEKYGSMEIYDNKIEGGLICPRSPFFI